MSYQIITDSAADLPESFIKEHDVKVLPLLVDWKGQEHEDRTLDLEIFYKSLEEGENAKTAQIPVHKFDTYFRDLAEIGEPVLYIAFSSGLSGTYQTGVMVADQIKDEYPDFDLTIIDSKAATTGMGLIVMKAIQLKEKGATKAEVEEAVHFYVDHVQHVFSVGNLDYLYRGGRLSKTSAVVGAILGVIPILHVTKEGKLEKLDQVRGRKKLLRKMIETCAEKGAEHEGSAFTVVYSPDMKAESDKLQGMIKENFQAEILWERYLGVVIGAHTGNQLHCVSFLDVKDPYLG
jgi:DegV family protein with EDD domain